MSVKVGKTHLTKEEIDEFERLQHLPKKRFEGDETMKKPESLQTMFRRLELQDMRKQQTPLEKDDFGVCGHAVKMDSFLRTLRRCDVDHIVCEHYNSFDLVRTCSTLRRLNAEKQV
jgi:hypothetical protein